MPNDKFLTSKGNYGIDFNQIDKIKLHTDANKYTNYGAVITLYVKKNSHPIVVLAYESVDNAKYVYRQLRAVVDNAEECKVFKLSDYRKD